MVKDFKSEMKNFVPKPIRKVVHDTSSPRTKLINTDSEDLKKNYDDFIKGDSSISNQRIEDGNLSFTGWK